MEISVETGKSQQKHGASITFQMLVSLVIIQQRRLLGINYFAPPRSLKSGATLLNGRGDLERENRHQWNNTFRCYYRRLIERPCLVIDLNPIDF